MSDDRFERDPEVVEDELLRARALRDTSRTGDPGRFKPARIIDQVPCRAPSCTAMADWPEEAEDAFQVQNSLLAKRNEAPLDKTRIVFCLSCRKAGTAMQGDRNRKNVEDVRGLIQQLKASVNPRNEHELIKKLTKMSHPDLKGLLDTIDSKREAKGARRSSAKDVL